MKHLRGNTMVSVDVETTGLDPAIAEIIQVGCVEVLEGFVPGRTFMTYVKPEHPELADPKALAVSGIKLEDLELAPSPERAADMLEEWASKLKGRMVMLAHNHIFEIGFLTAWLGRSRYESLFYFLCRDAMEAAVYLGDWHVGHGKDQPFDKVSLKSMCEHFGVVNTKAHDALADAHAEIEVYKKLCQ